MRSYLLLSLLLAPTLALAQQPHCAHSEPRDLSLDLAGVKTVVIEVGPHDLDLVSSAGAAGRLQGRACASDAERLKAMTLTQSKAGDKLIVKAFRNDGNNFNLFGKSNYAYLDLTGTLPDHIAVQLKVGSGDARVTGAPIFSADVGSGDVEASRIRGLAAASVGSGDVTFRDVGSLQVVSVGSGDLSASGVRGPVKVGSIGSGDFELSDVQGAVRIDSIGSGDASVSNVTGNVVLGSLGSGDFEAKDIRGNLTVESKGSGSVDHRGVTGSVTLPRKH